MVFHVGTERFRGEKIDFFLKQLFKVEAKIDVIVEAFFRGQTQQLNQDHYPLSHRHELTNRKARYGWLQAGLTAICFAAGYSEFDLRS